MNLNKLILGATLATLCGVASVALPAVAQQTANASQTAPVTQTATTTKAKADAQRAVPPLDSRMCIRDTGSHIPPPKGQCLPVAGNSYTQKDIRRTGATNVAQALQMLDPSVTVHGH
ncbi:MAG: hypothetical protein ACREP2_05575 [Rhodanobacteraceae bacterium]